MASLRLLLAAREFRDDALVEAIDAEAARAVGTLGAGTFASAMLRIDPDPFDAQYPGTRKFDAVVAVDAPEAPLDALIDVARDASQRFDDIAQPDLSGALAGELRPRVDRAAIGVRGRRHRQRDGQGDGEREGIRGGRTHRLTRTHGVGGSARSGRSIGARRRCADDPPGPTLDRIRWVARQPVT